MGVFLNRGNEEFKNVLNSKIYVDKTDIIDLLSQMLNTEQRYVCVSRPRRFGKSITANMIAAYFEKGCDSRPLFEDKKLGQIQGWDKNLNRFDTIRIDIADIRSQSKSGDETIDYIVKAVSNELYQEYPDVKGGDNESISEILSNINEKYGSSFIIIIDEWDCLFREDKEDKKVQQRYIELLRTLFKGNRAKKFTALAYITGILPIKKYNSESALNNFYEYTMVNPAMLSKYVGFTENEVKSLCDEYEMDFNKAKEWYDGYSFDAVSHIYGPNSVVRAMYSHQYDNYWTQTVAFSSLAGYINMNFDGLKYSVIRMIGGQMESVDVFGYENDMTSYKSKDDVLTMLIHLGYLAYDKSSEKAYIPNKEVRQMFERTIKNSDGWDSVAKAVQNSARLLDVTIACESDKVAYYIDKCHIENTSLIAYNDENSLASVIMLSYYAARKDYNIIREMPSGYGFADVVFVPKKNVEKPAMIIELKWNKNAETAIKQIKNKKYPESLSGWSDDILLVGINYDKDTKKHDCLIEMMSVS